MAEELISLKPIYFSGSLYSKEHFRSFSTERSEARQKRLSGTPNSFMLSIDGIGAANRFNKKYSERARRVTMQPTSEKAKA